MFHFQVTLKKREGATNDDKLGAYWDDFYVNPVNTNYIKVTFDTVYDNQGNGIMQLDAYAVPCKPLLILKYLIELFDLEEIRHFAS